ncbi:helix-turn-helix domain-containing protein [Actinoalloteichus hymeniacidonis]|uniref:Transcriptional regulator n=1 Tax=Actinoalloteichus hymeniacidonis TaxID=340345 RepID=A0AAC9HQE7_9PSEU|nr:MerR family transcriptional regulator [Actinoalloteichus hymeniacidonis]AOS63401.1 putative transcriptional regulator [Actinoalloteichus hymeniacidonis]MBB5908558.1 DNA-binding transcriptional MerR regulator [Actinoalloteichus hymeniacidonis]
MAWSTRQLAELAGTSLRAVRHYHTVGLLAEPERDSNGYKRYAVAHLVRLLRIKRLADLGFSLAQIANLADTDEHPEREMRALDAELAKNIERMQAVRAELAATLENSPPIDLPTTLGLSAEDVRFSEADRSFIVVLSRLVDPETLGPWAEMLTAAEDELSTLRSDADEDTRQRLAERLAEHLYDLMIAFPSMADLSEDSRLKKESSVQAIGAALVDLYNPAQIDVMVRMNIALAALREPATSDAATPDDDRPDTDGG